MEAQGNNTYVIKLTPNVNLVFDNMRFTYKGENMCDVKDIDIIDIIKLTKQDKEWLLCNLRDLCLTKTTPAIICKLPQYSTETLKQFIKEKTGTEDKNKWKHQKDK